MLHGLLLLVMVELFVLLSCMGMLWRQQAVSGSNTAAQQHFGSLWAFPATQEAEQYTPLLPVQLSHFSAS